MQLRVIQYCPHPVITPEQAASKSDNAKEEFQGKKSSEGVLTHLKPACTMEELDTLLPDVWSKLIGCSTKRYVTTGYQYKYTQQEESLRKQVRHQSHFQQIADEISWLMQSHQLLTVLFSTPSQSPPIMPDFKTSLRTSMTRTKIWRENIREVCSLELRKDCRIIPGLEQFMSGCLHETAANWRSLDAELHFKANED